ncbi:hypothetical protein TTHERM_00102850 (macronuclear) [Tetrahymena thermophila SB210]|uniref:Uncharacterized protein n=1 Tax=Tetrahymena thermophila (strain SB210) TaxID=312017 RepID=Q234L3_TETTS|nr:hypothetical protein TTHERM_00102850 [Tetrahymena thermophila SB210]EAR91990.2 hypothetical protein TTHERM_00102850 [Tetrahymena thermophila SB210]|eukprot:XP_001012235.2 hypothetical protein TTHERM_00102850 [Tetrahymena thermophila SB210]
MILTKPNLLEVDEGVLTDISLSLQKYDTQKVRGANLSFLKTQKAHIDQKFYQAKEETFKG